MNILVVGNGGREHALAWKIAPKPAGGPGVCRPRQRRHGYGRREHRHPDRPISRP